MNQPSTIHRRRLRVFLENHEQTTFRELKEQFVASGDMNVTTLYRNIDSLLTSGYLHEIHVGEDRIFRICQCREYDTHGDGIHLTYCTTCGHVSDTHFPLPNGSLHQQIIEQRSHCSCCTS